MGAWWGGGWKLPGIVTVLTEVGVKDAAPWIDDLTFVPLEPILPRDEEESCSTKNIFQMLGIGLFVGGVHTLIILGSVCLARRTTDGMTCARYAGPVAVPSQWSVLAPSPS